MNNSLFYIIFLLALILAFPVTLGAEGDEGHYDTIHHDLGVVLHPEEGRLTVQDTITLPNDRSGVLRFFLHEGMEPVSPTPGVKIVRGGREAGAVPIESYGVILPPGLDTFEVVYGGSISHPLEAYGKEYARGFSLTSGTISEQGVYLEGSSFWYPVFGRGFVTFDLRVELPQDWDAVSQGERTIHVLEGDKRLVKWESPEPQNNIFLVAARFKEYTRPAGKVLAMVFLRTPDDKLASRYLEATAQYISMYEGLIGPYPYGKFALVENFWETGFGMPSFTLLGPKVIRFPFILHSSYPHEILHNWWGNSVYLDYTKGNWSEGLTAYLSDHLIKEQRGDGAEYRQSTLQKYADYVLGGRDFPLTDFTARHSAATEAVGYGKSLMFFHMLRLELGDKTFIQGLRDFYKENKFRFASFEDLRRSFEKVSGKDLKTEFRQWVTRTGAPELRVEEAGVEKKDGGYVLKALIKQVQPGKVYKLRIPVAVTMEGEEQAHQTTLLMTDRQLEMRLPLSSRPLRLDVDPEFDVFRRLNREEIPPALSQAFGAEKMLILLPSRAEKALLEAYKGLASSIRGAGPDEVEVRLDKDVDRLPTDRAVTVLGWENVFRDSIIPALSGYDAAVRKDGVRLGKTDVPRENHTVVITARHPENRDLVITWIATDSARALPGLGRKLPHYHKYSYLGFEGDEPANMAKGRWPVLDSPMTVFLDGRVERGRLAPRKPLATLPPRFSMERMMETVRFLSDEALMGRGLGSEGLAQAAEHIAEGFREARLEPGGDNGYFHRWTGRGGEPEREMTMTNVIGAIPGEDPRYEGQSVVVAAHYDHLGFGWPDVREGQRGKVHPGADDNASGVAVLMELARVLGKDLKPARTVVFAAFTGEEAGKMGSRRYVSEQKLYPAEGCIGMINLDTVGRLQDGKLLVLGAGSAREWMHIFRGAGYVTGVEVETVSEELDSSDQISFHEAGVPAVQLFTGPHLDYHRPSDTAEKIDPEGLVKVASVAKEVVEYLAGREGPMDSTLGAGRQAGSETGTKRKVSLGIIPDFAFSGEGCRLSGVVPGSPAEECGLREGDIIVRIGADEITSLKDLSDVLKSLVPGDRITITFLRDGEEQTAEAVVVER
jgi:aminopeptidase N